METPEESMEPVQSSQERHQNDVVHVILLSLLLTLDRFHTLLCCFLF